MLTQLAEQAAGSTFVAIAFLGLLEVAPHANRLKFMARVMAAWWQALDANAEFWIDYGFGKRVCNWIDKALLGAPVQVAILDSEELATITDILVRSGTPLARALDERLTDRRKGNPS